MFRGFAGFMTLGRDGGAASFPLFRSFSSSASAASARRIEKLLVANRGEIACRVLRSAKALGIRTVAVYSDADKTAQHVLQADEAYRLGGPLPTDSYLRSDLIIDICKRSGAQAVHPGYGFLSENAGFANMCSDSGITFVGPPATAIAAMGSKSESKKIMTAAGVPVTPGYHGEDQSTAVLREEAKKIGYPVMIKAVMGGGGKGMRIAESEAAFDEALESCQRESRAAFGDDRVLIEKYVIGPRHIEFQVFADTHGNAVHLFERDCSVQRRHQKVLEEAPAPGMTPELRHEMGSSAVAAAKAVGYVGAGTVEFIVDQDKNYYFMEMNTRLQVEHPVTELVTGEDLVQWQLKVASGEVLPKTQEELTLRGHALEARVYAERPAKGFLPATGTLLRHNPPAASPNVRVDSGITTGDTISTFYDPMIAKLITYGENRAAALHHMDSALEKYEVVGLPTNISFLRCAAKHPAFVAGGVDTSFLEEHLDSVIPPAPAAPSHVVAMAAVGRLLAVQESEEVRAFHSHDPFSPWASATSSRPAGSMSMKLSLTDESELEREVLVTDSDTSGTHRITVGDETFDITASPSPEGYTFDFGDRKLHAAIIISDDESSLTVVPRGGFPEGQYHFDLPVEDFGAAGAKAGADSVMTPMPGRVIKVSAAAGDEVEAGQALMIMEAMKMEHTIRAPRAGKLAAVRFKEGDLVPDGQVLLSFVPLDE